MKKPAKGKPEPCHRCGGEVEERGPYKYATCNKCALALGALEAAENNAVRKPRT